MEGDKNNEQVNNNNHEFITFLRTILMILENHNFKETVKIFKNECNKLGYNEIDPPGSPIRDSKSSPKIIFENFSKTEPCRIIIESCTDDENNSSNINKNIPSNIPVYTKKPKNHEKLKDIKNHEIEESNDNDNFHEENNNVKQEEIIQITIPNIENENISNNNNNNDNKEKEQNVMLLNIENKITEKQDAYIETNELKTNSKSSTPNSKSSKPNFNTDDHNALKNKFSILQVEHHKLMDVVTELTFALQTSIKGQIEDTHVILNNCEKIYPELFCNKPMKSNIALIPKNTNQSEVPGNEIKSNCEFVNNNLKTMQDPIYKTCFNLDFQKVKHDLKNGDLNTKLLLLQALRWRITKTPDIVRDHIIRTYIRYDILNVHCCSHRSGITYPKNSIVFTSFYCSCKSPQSLQQAVARFVNAFASIKSGRDYIIHQSVILNILLSVMLGTHPSTPQIDGATRDMMIATLQKISLRYSARMIMITDGLTEYISKHLLTNYLTLSDYCLEYSIALLRNLWLHSESREKCHPIAQDIIKLLVNLLDEQYLFCLPYITGSLYNLLPDNYFHRAAKAINLERIIMYKIEKLEGEMKEQLQYILEIFLNPDQWQPLCECDLGVDSENEMDIIEPEIDLNENISYTNANGEQFLFGYRRTYSIDGAEINPNYINNIFSIPVTPNLSNLSAKCLPPKLIPEIEYLEYAAQFLNEKMNKKMLSITNETQYQEIQTEENVFHEETENKETINKKEIEMTYCEDTQQLYIVPSKNGIFEPEKHIRTFSPSFLKNIGEYDIKNISKSVPVSPRNKSEKIPEESSKKVTPFLTSTANFSGVCYREGLKPRSFSDSSTPHIGFCDEGIKNNNKNAYSKYSCACFVEMQRSFEEENKKKNNNEKVNLSIKNDISENITSTTYCKYKYKAYPTSNSAPINAAPKKERDTATSKSLDENDYTAVFESRPRLLRTP